ncbi:hypothetical protein AAAC51_29490 [Priestia megaterium]
MLVAQTEEGLISLAQRFSLEQLKLWKKKSSSTVPLVNPCTVKGRYKKIPHFAHLKKRASLSMKVKQIIISTENESCFTGLVLILKSS